MNNLISRTHDIPVTLKATISESNFVVLKKQRGSSEEENLIKNEAFNAVSSKSGFEINEMTAIINTDELRFQQNAPCKVDNIKEIEVTYKSVQWSCAKCNQLEERLDQQQIEIEKQKIESEKQKTEIENQKIESEKQKIDTVNQIQDAIEKFKFEIAEKEEMMVAWAGLSCKRLGSVGKQPP